MRASVVIPCRNAERTVADAVRSALEQTEPPLEVLVVDDASTDGSAAAARRAGARVIQNSSRRNAGGARNAGIAAARGDAFAFLDADAVAPRDWLARARRAFESDGGIVAVGGRRQHQSKLTYTLPGLTTYLRTSMRSESGHRRRVALL